MRIKTAFSILLILIFTSLNCKAVNHEELTGRLARIAKFNHADCCIYVNQAKVDKIDIGRTIEFTMEENSERLFLSTGPSFYKLFELPGSYNSERYRLESNFLNEDGSKTVFFPFYAILDEEFSIIKRSRYLNISYNHWTIFGIQEHLSVTIEAPPAVTNKQYLLIYTPVEFFTDTDIGSLSEWQEHTVIASDRVIQINRSYGDTMRSLQVYGTPSGQLRLRHER